MKEYSYYKTFEKVPKFMWCFTKKNLILIRKQIGHNIEKISSQKYMR